MVDGEGTQLEQEFSAFMESELGYTKTFRRVPMTGRVASTSHGTGIVGHRTIRGWVWVQRAGLALMSLWFFLWVLSFIPFLEDLQALALGWLYGLVRRGLLVFVLPEDSAALTDVIAQGMNAFASYAALLVGGGLTYVGWKSLRGFEKDVWVECHDSTHPVDRVLVEQLLASPPKPMHWTAACAVPAHFFHPTPIDCPHWRPTVLMMVSAQGYDEDALALAHAQGVECWERSDAAGGFRALLLTLSDAAH